MERAVHVEDFGDQERERPAAVLEAGVVQRPVVSLGEKEARDERRTCWRPRYPREA
jgi:hypothetical protein